MIFTTTLVYIALKSWQQLNVQHRRYAWMLLASTLMAVCEAVVVIAQVRNGFDWTVVLEVGLGGGVGAMTATYLFYRYNKRSKT